MDIIGIAHPLPTKYAERIYEDGKNVFISKSYLGKASKGDKFILYESHGAKMYTGEAIIKSISEMKSKDILKLYKDNLIISEEEFKEYVGNRKKMAVIELKNFKKFNTPVKPLKFVTISGKYITDKEYQSIIKKSK